MNSIYKKTIRALFFPQGTITTPSSRYRVYQFLPLLNKSTILKCRIYSSTSINNKLISKIYLIINILWANRIIFQKNLPGKLTLSILKLLRKKIFFDIDDSIWFVNPGADNSNIVKKSNSYDKIIHFMENDCDVIIAGNLYLANYFPGLALKTKILPTLIDTEQWKVTTNVNKNVSNGKVILGWIGTMHNLAYLQKLEPVFKHLYQKFGDVLEIRLISNGEFISNSDIHVKNIKWTLEHEVEEVAFFDIGLMPLPDDEWTRGKCAFKILQYMAMSIPCIASHVGMNTDVITDGVNGFLAENEEEWFLKLSCLIKNAHLRSQIGNNGRKTVEDHYSLKNQGKNLIEIISEV